MSHSVVAATLAGSVCSSIARQSGRWSLATSKTTSRLVIKNNLPCRSKKKPVALANCLSPDKVETRVTAATAIITMQFPARLGFSFFLPGISAPEFFEEAGFFQILNERVVKNIRRSFPNTSALRARRFDCLGN
jgi:hypothetical protein